MMVLSRHVNDVCIEFAMFFVCCKTDCFFYFAGYILDNTGTLKVSVGQILVKYC